MNLHETLPSGNVDKAVLTTLGDPEFEKLYDSVKTDDPEFDTITRYLLAAFLGLVNTYFEGVELSKDIKVVHDPDRGLVAFWIRNGEIHTSEILSTYIEILQSEFSKDDPELEKQAQFFATLAFSLREKDLEQFYADKELIW